jgi:anti-sigma factor RsiW
MTDPITEADLLGYVDDQIDVARRIEVEDYLAKHPGAAARIMADLRARDMLRLACAKELQRPSESLFAAARRLERALVWRGVGLRIRRAAAVVVLAGFGWFAHAQIGLFEIRDSAASPKPPPFVEDAVHAHHTALLRLRMVSQPATAGYDAAEILAKTAVQLPPMPAEWQVLDAQVFPSSNGHGVEIAIDAGHLGRVSLFAASVPAFNVIAPTIARFDRAKSVYWQTGPLAFALTGTGDDQDLERAALQLSRKLP